MHMEIRPAENYGATLCGNFAIAKRSKIERLEGEMLKMEQVECPVVHHFGPGIYIREVSMPAGTLAIGHAQKFEHLNVMIKGRVIMINDDGSSRELVAPLIFVGKPGRKVGHIVEDVVWQNIYATDETDIDVLEATYLDKSDVWKEGDEKTRAAEHIAREADRADYLKMLEETGFTHEIAVEQSENESDQIPFPTSSLKVRVADSPIQGKGLFASSPIECGEVIAPARIAGMRTPAGRYTNHSANPNAKMVLLDCGDIDLVASRRIDGCRGGDQGEEITIDYRQALSLSGILIGKEGKTCLE